MSETYIEVGGLWMSLHCAIDSTGDTVAFWFSERRSLAVKRFLARPLKHQAVEIRLLSTAAGRAGKPSCPAI